MDVIGRRGKKAPGSKPKPKKQKSYGKDFESDLLKSFERDFPAYFSMRIKDSSGYDPVRKQRFGHETPADMIVLGPNLGLLIECKATKLDEPKNMVKPPHSGRLEFDEVKPHQRAHLAAFERIGPHHGGVVAVCFYFTHASSKFRVKRAWFIGITQWKRAIRTLGKKSVSMQDLIDGIVPGIEIPWASGKIENGGGWQVLHAFTEVHNRRGQA